MGIIVILLIISLVILCFSLKHKVYDKENKILHCPICGTKIDNSTISNALQKNSYTP